jgi:hypothetical protein
MKPCLVAILVLVAVSSLFAEGFSPANILFGVNTLPGKDENGLKGNLGYRFSDRFASEVLLKNQVSAETGPLSVDHTVSSLNLERMIVTEWFILPAEFSFDLSEKASLTLSAGAYISKSSVQDVGHFNLEPTWAATAGIPETNSYDTTSDATFYGPVITADGEIDLGFLSFNPRVVVVPFFLFNQSQTLSLNPYLAAWKTGSLDYKSNGFPYIAVSVADIMLPVGKLFGINWLQLGGGLEFEYTLQNAQQLTPSGSKAAPTWVGEAKKVSSTILGYQGKLGIKFENKSSIKLGIGQKISTADDGTNKSEARKIIYSVAYDIKR